MCSVQIRVMCGLAKHVLDVFICDALGTYFFADLHSFIIGLCNCHFFRLQSEQTGIVLGSPSGLIFGFNRMVMALYLHFDRLGLHPPS